MSQNLEIWVPISVFLSLWVFSSDAQLGRSTLPASNLLQCAGEPVKIKVVHELIMKCKGENTECPERCAMQKMGLITPDNQSVKTADEVAKALVSSGMFQANSAQTVADGIVLAECPEIIENGNDCDENLDYGDCFIHNAVAACNFKNAKNLLKGR
ncbi:unnamed protein product [Allacma fusca]|uniref:Uncharacterized protein n=1 Tax=Allacma fusca TaxID=39272 RepID=A0A8J2LR93_9HEXA|nr:unnamed protein product [Allacma fusca]